MDQSAQPKKANLAMNKPTLLVMSRADNARLLRLVARMRAHNDNAAASLDERALDAFELELERAEIVAPAAVPSDVVAMNARVVLEDLDDRARLDVALVYPADASAASDTPGDPVLRISVLGPLGVALLGSRELDEIEWPAATSSATATPPRRMRIARVTHA